MPPAVRLLAGARTRAILAAAVGALVLAPTSGASPSGGAGLAPPDRGAGIPSGGLAPTHKPSRIPPAPGRNTAGTWLNGVTITEYWPAPESWFVGRSVSAPGLWTRHRIDWLYSATGLSMEGEGIGLDGRFYHIDHLGNGGWVTEDGQPTDPSDGWSAGPPFWRAGGYWANRTGGVTFPLATGGWSAGTGLRYVPLAGVTFAPGPPLPLRYYQSIAVDPSLIPLGSRVYIPAYRRDGHGGWFLAQDTGGAINGRHVDVFRSPPARPDAGGQYLTAQRVFVVPSLVDRRATRAH
ncbi:MAG: hypothetical protein JO039_17670 [Solirubrobacterales bacterium]|nr:hypothetical protein [Solirubrobacterales bacterium]